MLVASGSCDFEWDSTAQQGEAQYRGELSEQFRVGNILHRLSTEWQAAPGLQMLGQMHGCSQATAWKVDQSTGHLS